MVELIVTMVLIGIMAAVAIPRLDALRGFDQVAYRDKLRAAVEFSRKSAVASRRYVCVRITSNLLTVTRDTRTPETATTFCNAASEAPLPLPGSATNILAASGSATLSGTASFYFDPLGQASTSAAYTITGEGTETVNVVAASGYVF